MALKLSLPRNSARNPKPAVMSCLVGFIDKRNWINILSCTDIPFSRCIVVVPLQCKALLCALSREARPPAAGDPMSVLVDLLTNNWQADTASGSHFPNVL